MAQYDEQITASQRATIEKQKVFFVATAGSSGTINLSPRGHETLRILDDQTVAWVDYPGSGNQTAAHLAIRPDITLMICDLEGTDRIVRLFGIGRAVLPESPEFGPLLQRMDFAPEPIIRQVFVVKVRLTQSSCGKGVPVYEYQGEGNLKSGWNKIHAAGKFAATLERFAGAADPDEELAQRDR